MLVEDTLAEVLSRAGLRQLHVAETEKYAHVTYFFNGGREEEWPGETRDPRAEPARRAELRPQAGDVGARGRPTASATRSASGYAFGVDQLREPGHGRPHRLDSRGRRSRRDGRRVPRPGRRRGRPRAGGVCLVTADHGNAEQLLAADGVSPHTAHTTNPVPLVVTDRDATLGEGGELADLAPTVLALSRQLEQATKNLTGASLVYEAILRHPVSLDSA